MTRDEFYRRDCPDDDRQLAEECEHIRAQVRVRNLVLAAALLPAVPAAIERATNVITGFADEGAHGDLSDTEEG